MDEIDKMLQQWEDLFAPKIEYDENGNIACTMGTLTITPWTHTAGYDYPLSKLYSYSFLRAICDKYGKVLSYVNAKKLAPDPYYSHFHAGCWYAFEEYRPELMKNFKIHTLGYPGDEIGATWQYDANMRLYTLDNPQLRSHWFEIEGNHIKTDYGEHDIKTYPYNVVQQQPNKRVLDSVQYGLKSAKVVLERQTWRQKMRDRFRRSSH